MSRGADGKPVTIEVISSTRYDLSVVGSGWRIVRSGETAARMFIDGVEQGVAAPLSAEERAAIVADLQSVARPLQGVDPRPATDDLAPLAAMIADARIVALGKSSHGSSEQFRMKRRIIEFLAAEKGFTVVALEANWSSIGAVDAYVKGSGSSLPAALESLGYWIWRTEEMKGLIDWMRRQNEQRGAAMPLSFAGFDMQQLDVPAGCVVDRFGKLGGQDYDRLIDLYAPLLPAEGDAVTPAPAEISKLVELWQRNSHEALAIVDRRRGDLIKTLSQQDFEEMRQCANVIAQNADNIGSGFNATVRDKAMADNIAWLAEVAHPGEKIIVWAHNNHVGNAPFMLGSHLRKAFGDDISIIALMSHHGEIRASPYVGGKVKGALHDLDGPIAIALAEPDDGSVDDVLNAIGEPLYFVDLKGARGKPVLGSWLGKPQIETAIGWPYDPARPNLKSVVLSEAYDGLVFIAKSSASVLAK